jgi:hypothetical protein
MELKVRGKDKDGRTVYESEDGRHFVGNPVDWRDKYDKYQKIMGDVSDHIIVANWFLPEHIETFIGRKITEEEYLKLVREWQDDELDELTNHIIATVEDWLRMNYKHGENPRPMLPGSRAVLQDPLKALNLLKEVVRNRDSDDKLKKTIDKIERWLRD